MTFVTAGLAVAGLAAISIPIIIHLLWRQRRRPVEWAAMRFLIEAFKKQKRRMQIEQLLLLATRCLIVLLLGLALARPLLQAAGVLHDEAERAVFIVLDNGLTSAVQTGAESTDTALMEHIEQAIEVIQSLGESEAVGLVTAARPVRGPILPPSRDHRAVIEVLRSIESADTPADIAEALRLVSGAAAQVADDGRTAAVYLLSQFRAGSAPLDAPLPPLFESDAEGVVLLAAPPAAEAAGNVQVVDINPLRRVLLPGAIEGSQQVTVTLARHGGALNAATTRVRLRGDHIGAVDPHEVQWSPGQTETSTTFSLDVDLTTSERITLTAVIEPAAGASGGDSLRADNQRFTTIDVRDRIRVAMISPPTFERIGMIEQLTPGQWIRRALQTGSSSPMDVVDVAPSSLDAADLRGVDAGILVRPDRLSATAWEAVRGFVDDGGLLVITPPHEVNVHAWTDQLASVFDFPWRVSLETTAHPDGRYLADEQPRSELLHMLEGELSMLVRPVVVFKSLEISPGENTASPILLFDDGTPAMLMSTPGGDVSDDDPARGLVVYLAVAPVFPDWTTLPTNMLMVPLFQETLRQGLSLIRATERFAAGEQPVLTGVGRAAALRTAGGETIALDRERRPVRPLGDAGLYAVLDAAANPIGHIAVNVDPRAGRTEPQNEAAVAAWLGDSGSWRVFDANEPAAALAGSDRGRSIAGKLLIALLALVLLESILARRFSHAYRHGRTRALAHGLQATTDTRPA